MAQGLSLTYQPCHRAGVEEFVSVTFCIKYGNKATVQDGHFSVTSRFQMIHKGVGRLDICPLVLNHLV